MSESAPKRNPAEHLAAYKWQPGQSPNPAGRPKGSRNKLGEAFIEAMHDDFAVHGKSVIVEVRTTKPDQYLKVIASLLPKELHVKDETLADLSDNELVEYYTAVRSLAAAANGAAAKRRVKPAPANPEPGSQPH